MTTVKMMTIAALFAGSAAHMWAQQAPRPTTTTQQPVPATQVERPTSPDARQGPLLIKTFHLMNITQQYEANELQTALRNMIDPRDKIYLVPSQSAIVVQANQADLDTVQRVLSELDRPKKTYRLTYTITETEGGKRLGTQHFSMIVVAGQRTLLKQGSKIPISTGTSNSAGVSYQDIGMSFDATLDDFANGVRLRSVVDETSVPEEKSMEPVIRQTRLEGTSFLAPGKPMMLGSLDVPGSTRHLDVEVLMEQAL